MVYNFNFPHNFFIMDSQSEVVSNVVENTEDDLYNEDWILQLYIESDEEDFLIHSLLENNLISDTREKGKSKKRKRMKRRFIVRDHAAAHNRIMTDYLVPAPRYTEEQFRRRFRMSSRLFRYIWQELERKSPYFKQKKDGTGRNGLSSLQKVVAALRMIAYGEGGDRQDEYCSIGEKTALETRKYFCQFIVTQYSSVYLRKPTDQDVTDLLHQNNLRGFPGMLGTFFLMHLT